MTGVFFGGRHYVSPVTVSAVDDTAMYARGLSVGNLLAIVGKSEGGKPATPLRFGSPSQARAVLRSGEALRAIEKAFDPSAQTGGPAEIVFVRVNPATQSTLTLLDASAGNAITLTSTDYGAHTKQIRVKVESGSSKGKKITTQQGNNYYSQDNIFRDAFTVRYTGAAAASTLTVSNTTVTLTADAETTALDLNTFTTIGALVDRINTMTGFTAAVLDGNTEKPALNGLDAVTSQDIKTATYTATAHLQACVDWINGAAEGFLTATRAGTKVPANIAFTYLTGGSDGTVTTSEWQAAFDALQSVDVQWVVPVSPDAAIHAMADTHVQFMSSVARKERRAIVGSDSSATDAAAIALAKALNSDRTSLVHIGFYDYNSAGVLTLYPPYILAAQIAGAFSGVAPGTALTNKSLKVRGLERDLRNPTDTDQLILGGVMPVENTDQGYKVVQSISTWLVNDNYNRVEVSTGVAIDYVSRNIRNALDVLRGEGATPLLLSRAISISDTTLRALALPQPTGPGVIVGDANSPAYRNITARIEGDALYVEFECSPVIPANYVLVTIHAVPYSGSASA